MKGSHLQNSFDSEQESEEEINPVNSLLCSLYGLQSRKHSSSEAIIMLGNLSEKFRCDSYIILWVGISYDMIEGMYSPHAHKHTLKLMVRQPPPW